MIVKHPTRKRAWIIIPDGAVMISNVHRKGQCAGEACTIHNPSSHHMRDWPHHYRGDRRLFERICPHDIGHPDPDDLAWRPNPDAEAVHGCDGCCAAA